MPYRTPHRKTWFFSGLLIGLMILSLTRMVDAGPVTNGPNAAPFTKLGVYGGVLTVVGSGQALEIGNAGRDIGGTSDIYFRPTGVPEINGARIFANGGRADLLVTNQLCLFNGGAPDCRSDWPAGGAGSSYWSVGGSPAGLAPTNSAHAVGIGENGNRVTALAALDVQSAAFSQFANTNLLGSAATLEGNVQIDGWAIAFNQIKVNDNPVWWASGLFGVPTNEGRFCENEPSVSCTFDADCASWGGQCKGSGLDADLLDTQNMTLQPAVTCNTNPNSGQALLCICVTISGQQKCAPMWNHI